MDTDATTVVASAGPEDLLATVWFRLGYRPQGSLVLVGLDGPRRRVGLILRADLPRADHSSPPDGRHLDDGLPAVGCLPAADGLPAVGCLPAADGLPRRERRSRSSGSPTSGDQLRCLVTEALSAVAGSGARAVLAVVADEAALARPAHPVVDLLQAEASALGLELTDVLGAGRTAFGSLLCEQPDCCPTGGRPLEAVMSSRAALVHVLHGDTVADSEAKLITELLPPDLRTPAEPAARTAPLPLTAQERRSWWRLWLAACAASPAGSPDGAVTGSPAHRPADGSTGRPVRDSAGVAVALSGLSGALHDAPLRDAVLVHLLGGTEQQVTGMLAGEPAGDLRGSGAGRAAAAGRADLGALLAREPDLQTTHPGRAVLAQAVRSAEPGDRGPALAVLAMLAWFEGKAGRARLLVRGARSDTPLVSLTGLVEDLLTHQVSPPWRRGR